MKPILPGKTVGILGGGQLGRMFGIAARRMGYRVHAFDPTNDCPAGQVADLEVSAPYDDIDAALRFANGVDVVTFEFENIPAETLQAISEVRPVHPSPGVLQICRHRLREKTFLSENGFPVAPFRAVCNAEELANGIQDLGVPAILKTADFGYDGKGQTRIDEPGNWHDIWRQMGRPVGVLEAFVPFAKEISVICARGMDGKMKCFPPSENIHVNHILDVSMVPADVTPEVSARAVELAEGICAALNVIGLLAVELFVLPGGELVVNELAPRPHNSGHFSFDACVTCQFEQQLRAVCGLPLGDVTLHRPVAMVNLLGDLWANGEPAWEKALAMPEVKLHLYGKREPRIGRKMGHMTAMADAAEEAKVMALQAREAL